MSQQLVLRAAAHIGRLSAAARPAARSVGGLRVPAAPAAGAFGTPHAGLRRRMISSTAAVREDPKEAQAAAAAKKAGEAEEEPGGPTPFEHEVEASSTPDDPVPEWQNPRHHNDPDRAGAFEEDFGGEGGSDRPADVALPPFEDGSGSVLASPEVHAIADEILHMNMIEVNELCNRLAEHFGIKDAEGGMMMAAEGGEGGEEGGADGAAEEKTAFDLKLTGFDKKAKIKVIKEVRAMAGLGLKEAKELVEGAPKTVMAGLKREEAEELAKKLEDLGATVEIA